MNPQIPLLPITNDAPGAALDLGRLLSTRLLIQAASGGGKSRALRYILEQTHGHVQQFVIDPEGEFASLREKHDFILAGEGGDVPAQPASAALLCRRLMDLGASAVIDLYALSPEDRRKFVRLFLEQLMALSQEYWRPLIVAIDEAQDYVPERGYGDAESAKSVIRLCCQGRKRGYTPILATQRVSKIRKDAVGDLLNKMIGLTAQDVDVKRASDEMGMDARSRAALKRLHAGQFYVTGPAFVGDNGERLTDLLVVRTGDVRTSHPEPGSVGAYKPPPAPAAIAALLAQMQDIPAEAQAEAQTVEELRLQAEELRRQVAELRSTRPAASVTEKIVERIVEKAIEVPVIDAQTLATLQETMRGLETHVYTLTEHLRGVSEAITRVSAPPAAHISPPAAAPLEEVAPIPEAVETPAALPTPAEADPSKFMLKKKGDLVPPQQKVLDVLASFEALGIKSVSRANVAAYAGFSSRSSTYSAHLSRLKESNLVDYPRGGTLCLTASGREAANAHAKPATRRQLHEAWLRKLPDAQSRIISVLIEVFPSGLTRDGLAQRSAYSPTSSTFSGHVSELKSMGLVAYPKPGAVCASKLLFPNGLP